MTNASVIAAAIFAAIFGLYGYGKAGGQGFLLGLVLGPLAIVFLYMLKVMIEEPSGIIFILVIGGVLWLVFAGGGVKH